MRLFLPLLAVSLLPLSALAQSASPTILKGLDGIALCTAVSADGKFVAIGGQNGTVALWDSSQHQIRVLKAGDSPVMAIAFAPKGDFIAAAFADKTIHFLNTPAGTEKVPSLKAFSDPKDPGDVLTCVAVSGNGKWVAGAGWDGKIRVINLIESKKGDPDTTVRDSVISAEQGPVFSLAVSPDGKWLASGGRNGTVKIWDAVAQKLHATLSGHGKTVWSVSWTTNSDLLAASAGSDVNIWNVADQKVVAVLKGHTGAVRSVAFAAGNMKLVSGSEDKSVHIWDLPEKELGKDAVIDHFQAMSAATQLRGKEEEQRQGRPLFEKGFISAVEWNGLGAEVTRLKALAGKSKEFHELTDGIVYSVAASPDGKLIVAATKDPAASVRVWKAGKE